MERNVGSQVGGKLSRTFKTVKSYIVNPRLIIDLLSRKKYGYREDGQGLSMKNYSSYDEYVTHQAAKLAEVQSSWLPDYDRKYHVVLRERLKERGFVSPQKNVLCLAARIGTEVRSFLDLGCFAVGLDLNPGEKSRFVLHGDFHDIQFPESSVDIIFCNAVDHAFDLEKLIAEMKRTMKHGGLLILELSKGKEDGYKPGYYESMSWKRVDDILDVFLKHGFSVLDRSSFEYPDPGEHVVLELRK